MHIMSRLIRWLTMRDYQDAKQEASLKIVQKQSRGSVLAQNGRIMSQKQLERNSREADIELRSINEIFSKAQ